MYAVRSSDGSSSGNVSDSDFSGSDFFSSVAAASGGAINVGCILFQRFLMNVGIGIVSNGFFVRMISVVVAT